MSKVFLNNKGIDPEESVIGFRGKLIKVSELLESYHKEQLNLCAVSQQRELLAFLMWYDEKMYHSSNKETALQVIDEYKANCG